jgi:3',5'-cyclic AMP phosphodiesterase CpdA
MIVFAQISDIHLDGSQRRYERAAAVMSYLDGMPVRLAAVLVTGDIADHGLPGEYEQARALFASSPHPVFPCPGNHDVRAAYRKVLLGGEGGESGGAAGGPDRPVNRVHYTEGALFALCDSTIPGRDDGCLTDDSIAWLDHVLTQHPGVPAFRRSYAFTTRQYHCTARTLTRSGSSVRTAWPMSWPGIRKWWHSCAGTRIPPVPPCSPGGRC